jgi:hypothetical protein
LGVEVSSSALPHVISIVETTVAATYDVDDTRAANDARTLTRRARGRIENTSPPTAEDIGGSGWFDSGESACALSIGGDGDFAARATPREPLLAARTSCGTSRPTR